MFVSAMCPLIGAVFLWAARDVTACVGPAADLLPGGGDTGAAAKDCLLASGYWKDNLCYKVVPVKTTWNKAEEECQKAAPAAHLASFTSDQQFMEVSLASVLLAADVGCVIFWTGLNDIDVENTWEWTDGTAADWIKWVSNPAIPLGFPVSDIHMTTPVQVDLDFDCVAGTVVGFMNMLCDGATGMPANLSFSPPPDIIPDQLSSLKFEFTYGMACPMCTFELEDGALGAQGMMEVIPSLMSKFTGILG